MRKQSYRLTIIALLLLGLFSVTFYLCSKAYAADLVIGTNNPVLTWDHNDPRPGGYRIFQRAEGESYNYQMPIWQDSTNITEPLPVPPDIRTYFVVRAFLNDIESADSAEVGYLKVTKLNAPMGFTINNTGTVIINMQPTQ